MKATISRVAAIAMLVVGVLLIVFHSRLNLLTWIVEAIGVLIVVPAVWTICVNAFGQRRNWAALIASIVALGMGVWVCVSPEFFAGFLIYVFAAVLIIAGAVDMYSLNHTGRVWRVPVWLYLIPALLIVAGLAFIFTGLRVMTSAVVLIMGIALVAGAFNRVAAALRRRHDTRNSSED